MADRLWNKYVKEAKRITNAAYQPVESVVDIKQTRMFGIPDLLMYNQELVVRFERFKRSKPWYMTQAMHNKRCLYMLCAFLEYDRPTRPEPMY